VKKKIRHSIKFSLKSLRNLFAGSILLLITTLLLFQLPIVQRQILDTVLDHLYKTTQYKVTYDVIRLDWFRTLCVSGVRCKDPKGQLICVVQDLKAQIKPLYLLFQTKNCLSTLCVDGAKIYVDNSTEQHVTPDIFYEKLQHLLIAKTNSKCSIQEVRLHALDFYYSNPMERQNIAIEEINIGIDQFVSMPNLCSGILTHLSYRKSNLSPLVLKNVTTQFIIDPTDVILRSCKLTTAYSHLEVDWHFQHVHALLQWFSMNQVGSEGKLDATCKRAIIASTDLGYFIAPFKNRDLLYELEGSLVLTRDSIAWKDSKWGFGLSDNAFAELTPDKAWIEQIEHKTPDLHLSEEKLHIPSPPQVLDKLRKVSRCCIKSRGKVYKTPIGLQADVYMYDSIVSVTDVAFYLKEIGNMAQLPPYLDLTVLDHIGIPEARFVGNSQNAKLIGSIATQLGTIQTDLSLENLSSGLQTFRYSGAIQVDQLAIDKLIPSYPMGKLSMKLILSGQYLHPERVTMKATAPYIQIKTDGYTYNNISADCMLHDGCLAFCLKNQDSDIAFEIKGNYDTIKKKNLTIDGTIMRWNIDRFVSTNAPIQVSMQVGLTVHNPLESNLEGTLTMNQLHIESRDKKIFLKTCRVDSIHQAQENVLTIASPFIDLQLKGRFTIAALRDHIQHWVKKSNRSLYKHVLPFHLNYTLTCKEISPLVAFFSEDVHMYSSTTLRGHINYDAAYDFSIGLSNKIHIQFKQFAFEDLDLDVVANHLNDPDKRFVQCNVSSPILYVAKKVQTDPFSFQLLLEKNKINILCILSELKYKNNLHIACSGSFIDDVIHLNLLPSRATIGDKVWKIKARKTSLLTTKSIHIGDVAIHNGHQSIVIGGELTRSHTTTPLYCIIKNLAFNFISEPFKGSVEGMLDANFCLSCQDNNLIAIGKASIQNTKIENYSIGAIYTSISWYSVENKLILDGVVQKKDQYPLHMHGYYHLSQPKNNIALTVALNKLDVSFLNGLAAPIFSKIQGKLSGDFTITGRLNAPELNGQGSIEQGQLQIDYLHTVYQVKGDIQVKNNRLHITSCHMYDDQEGYAKVSGSISLKENFSILLSASMHNLHLLNTRAEHNTNFYGSIYASGSLELKGPVRDLVLKAKGTAERGEFTIISDDRAYLDGSANLVRFIDRINQKPLVNDSLESLEKDMPSFKCLLDLTILPTVTTVVLLGSYTSKDIIKGQGNGVIQFEVGTYRTPYIMGNYVFDNGTFVFSVYNFMKKKFDILKNSQIAFNGYPKEGVIHIQASYKQKVSVKEIAPKSHDQRPIPIEIVLTADGVLASPRVSYALCFPEKTTDASLNATLESCASRARLDKSYVNKQILSVLIAKRLYNDTSIAGWDAISNSISDFCSQHIQDWASKIDQNLEIETDLGMIQTQADHQAEVLKKSTIRIGYRTLSGRLKFSSKLGRFSNLINDWEVSYIISKADGISTKIYNRPLEDQSFTSLFGISFVFTKKIRK